MSIVLCYVVYCVLRNAERNPDRQQGRQRQQAVQQLQNRQTAVPTTHLAAFVCTFLFFAPLTLETRFGTDLRPHKKQKLQVMRPPDFY